jgi:uncharacterized membrane protein YfhO
MAVPLTQYRQNAVELNVTSASGGLLVLKDVYAAGWFATLNGNPVPIVRVNGLVRGVFIPSAGQHTVRFTYLPTAFVYGAWLSVATAGLLAVVTASAAHRAWASRRRRAPTPTPPPCEGEGLRPSVRPAPSQGGGVGVGAPR